MEKHQKKAFNGPCWVSQSDNGDFLANNKEKSDQFGYRIKIESKIELVLN